MAYRWPKVPFPDKYRFDAVSERLARGRTTEIDELVSSLGLVRTEVDDPLYRVVVAPEETTLAVLRAHFAPLDATVVHTTRDALTPRDFPSSADGGGPLPPSAAMAFGIVASPDPIDAVVAIGVAGPFHGIGTATSVRFLVTLRTLAKIAIDTISESSLGLTVRPHEDAGVDAIADRVLHICPQWHRRGVPAERIATALRTNGRLDLGWADGVELGRDADRPHEPR